jgi:serine/threonine-protein kinase
MIGETISHYKILEILGEGGMGVVYKAEDTRLKRVVALKFLSREAVSDPMAKSRLLHEAQAAAALDHPNICTVYEIEEVEGHTFIVMAIAEGESVRAKITSGPLPLRDAVDVAEQVARGLAEAHKKGIVHRDVKPANLMVSDEGRAKITDFGLARAEGQSKLTKTGTSVGTIAYMSPEQAQGRETDHRTDIWSLGVTLYEMISGRLPFRGGHEHAVLYSILNEDPDPLTAIRTGVPADLERLVKKAMSKRPEARYQHVDDLLVDLKAVERQLEVSGEPNNLPRSSGAKAGGGRKRPRAGILAGAVVLTAAVAAITFFVSQRGGDERAGTAPAGTKDDIQSLAVLPFDNMMNDPEQDYFVDGIHEALITGLSKLGSLRVISRTSVMRFKHTEKPLPEIAGELNVDVLIEGSVLRVGNEVQITAQLIDGATDEHLWANSYVRDMRNVLALINEVAGAIAGEIQTTLTPEQQRRLARVRPVDPDAYELLLRGKQLFNTMNSNSVRKSIEYFREAIDLDSGFAEAHGWMAGGYMVLAVLGAPPMEVMPRSKEAALKALELDDEVAVAHTAMGYVYLYFDRDWKAGGEAFRRALQIDPNSAMARHGYADYLTVIGQLDEAVEEVKRGRMSNPLSPLSNAVVVGHLYLARRYGEAIDEARRLLTIDPDYPGAASFLRRSYWQLGRFEEAVESLRETRWGSQPRVREALDRGYAKAGPQGAMLAVARLLESEADSSYVSSMSIALYYAAAGEGGPAVDWLEKAEEMREPTLVHILMDPVFDVVRDSPRFKAIRRRMNLP